MVKGFDFSREAFEENLERIIESNRLLGYYDVTTTMIDRGKRVSDRVYFIPLGDRLNMVIYSTVDVVTDRSPVEATSRWDVEMYWVIEDVMGTRYRLFRRLNRTYDLFDHVERVVGELSRESDQLRELIKRNGLTGFSEGWPYE